MHILVFTLPTGNKLVSCFSIKILKYYVFCLKTDGKHPTLQAILRIVKKTLQIVKVCAITEPGGDFLYKGIVPSSGEMNEMPTISWS